MPKSKRLITYYSGMMEPLCQYVINLELVVTPYDPKGNNLARMLYTHYKGGSPLLKQPDAKVDSQMKPYNLH